MLNLNSAGWSNTYAWMVDKTGVAIPVENHVQKGEGMEDQLDEYGIVVAFKYAQEVNDSEYYEAACVLAQEDIFNNLYFDEEDEIIDFQKEIDWLVDKANKQVYLKALQLPSFVMSAKDVINLYSQRGIDNKVEGARRTLHTLFERLMMRVRVGGVINTTSKGNTDIYFRIPDSTPNGWYTGIANFLYDHPQYVGFTLHIYEEADTAGSRHELESYTDGGEFIDLHASKAPSVYKANRLNSARKRKAFLNARFLNSLKK